MEEHELFIVEWINGLLGHPIAVAFGMQVEEGEHVIPTQVIMATLVMIFCFVFFIWLRSQLSVENPGKVQQVFEVVVESLGDQLDEIVGPKGWKYLNLVGTLGVFIVFSNLLGLIPGFAAPTSNINVPAGCAFIVFFYYNFQGMREHGVFKYLKHFAGPIWWMAPLMIPIEIISHLARPFSLTIRLFVNIFAEEALVLAFFALFGIGVLLPLPLMAYALFGGLLQGFIFLVLTMVYLGGAVATEEHS